MIAAAQRGRPIGLYDMEEGIFLGLCEREADTELERTDFALLWVRNFIFNHNPDTSLLAVLHHDGDLILFDPCELVVKTITDRRAGFGLQSGRPYFSHWERYWYYTNFRIWISQSNV